MWYHLKSFDEVEQRSGVLLPARGCCLGSEAAARAARWAPMPLQPKTSGPAVSSTHFLAMVDVALIHTPIAWRNKPIGL